MKTFYQISGIDLEDYYIPTSIFTYGGLWLSGRNNYGQLGDNTVTWRSSPVQTIAYGINWLQAGIGGDHSAIIKSDGTLWTWGRNSNGQLGEFTTTDKSSPVQTVSGGTNWKQVSGGGKHTAAIKADGTLWTWGWNLYGQLGDNSVANKSSPVQTIGTAATWKQVSAGTTQTSAVKTDGTLWSWGYNLNGQLGDNSVTSRSSPVQTISLGTDWLVVSSGDSHTVAIKTDGSLWTWGRNSESQLGDGTTVQKSSPVQTVSGGTNWKQISCGLYHSLALKTDGTLWGWGNNGNGQLGDNTVINRSSPVQTVSGGTNWRQVSGGYSSTGAVKTDGSLWLWGRNDFGQLGDGTSVQKSSPVQTVALGNNWKQVSCGLSYQFAAIQDNTPY